MSRITIEKAQGWVEGTKFTIASLSGTDGALLDQIETEVLARVSAAYITTTWVDAATTPALIQVAIAKKFVAWMYRKAYSEDITENDAAYAAFLEANSELIIQGIVDGSIEIPELPPSATSGPLFYPTDASSAMEPTVDDSSLGPNKFSMGMIF